MDPVPGLSLAVNVLAVVDFLKTSLEVLGQVSEAGSPATTQHIGGIVRSLKTSNAKVKGQFLNGHEKVSLQSDLRWLQFSERHHVVGLHRSSRRVPEDFR